MDFCKYFRGPTVQKIVEKVKKVTLAELFERCPPIQMENFNEFRNKTLEYRNRLEKYPEFLPKIDWSYYRKEVRSDYVNMVHEFEKEYEKFNAIFNARHELDTTKYYVEWHKVNEEVKKEITDFISESNQRIVSLEQEIERINMLKPYDQMTMEEFCTLCPDKAEFIPCGGKPSFWPHTPEEQRPGPAVIQLEGAHQSKVASVEFATARLTEQVQVEPKKDHIEKI